MRARRRLPWIIFALCAMLVVDGLGWVTWQGLRLERREREAELLRLALWRMDSELSPLLAREASRPYFHYRSFYPAERAYTRMWEEILPNEVLVPSPLLESPGPMVRLHFEIDPSGRVCSPQAPEGNMRDQAEATYVTSYEILRAEEDLRELASILGLSGFDRKESSMAKESRLDDELLKLNETEWVAPEANERTLKNDYGARQQVAETARGRSRQQQTAPGQLGEAGVTLEAMGLADADRIDFLRQDARNQERLGTRVDIDQGALRPVWLDRAGPTGDVAATELLVTREVRIGGVRTLQGFWVDWPALEAALLASIKDLFPSARLSPVREALRADAGSRVLATIPLVVETGPPIRGAGSFFSSTRLPLFVTWVAVVGAIAAIGVVLRTSMELSERRGRFVSAVTHELRTPLTTFCLYSQMLDDGIVSEESKRRDYLKTLRNEADRLARIVENVLEFARLGERRRSTLAEPIDLAEVLGRLTPILEQRAAQCGMTLRTRIDLPDDARRLRLEPEPIERIVTNLVENACKYAGEGEKREIELTVEKTGSRVEVAVRDFGPGVPPGEEGKVFLPFHRARRDQNGSKSGLGLGLALARGLARELGGDLVIGACQGSGARFVLSLPIPA